MKYFLVIVLAWVSFSSYSQTTVNPRFDYKITYNTTTCLYEARAVLVSGTFAGAGQTRIPSPSTFTVAIPASYSDAQLTITSVFPVGKSWTEGIGVRAPNAKPEYDFHPVAINGGGLNNAYPTMVVGDEVVLFTFPLETVDCAAGIRPYINGGTPGGDPSSLQYANAGDPGILIYNSFQIAAPGRPLDYYNSNLPTVPPPTPAASVIAACNNGNITFDLTATAGTPCAGLLSYAWTGPNGFTSTSQDVSVANTPATRGTYEVTVTDQLGCKRVVSQQDVCVVVANPDLSVTKTDNKANFVPGTNNVYTIVVSNTNVAAVTGARFTDNAPAGTSITSWTATFSGGATGALSGNGNINQLVNMPVSSSITYTVTLAVPANYVSSGLNPASITNTATISVPTGVTDSNPSNNTSSDTDTYGCSGLNFTTIVEGSRCGQANASITVNGTGGTAPYQYSINNGVFGSNQVFAGLAIGTYAIQIKDVNGCTFSSNVNVGAAQSSLSAAAAVTNAQCGAVNGSIQLSASNGAAPYQYSTNGGQSYVSFPSGVLPVTFANLAPGTYSYKIKDAANCIFDVTATIIATNATLVSLISKTDANCNGLGTASVQASGGTAPYTYSWNSVPAKFTASVTGLSAGNYLVTVTDATGCAGTLIVSISEASGLDPVGYTITQPLCTETTGSIVLTQSGNNITYTVTGANPVRPSVSNTSGIFTGLLPGRYSLGSTDGVCNSPLVFITISNPPTVCGKSISGNVFDDGNNSCAPGSENTIDGPGTNISNTLYAQLVNSSGSVIATTPVSASGAYSFANVVSGIYRVVLNNSATASAVATLPSGWVYAGEKVGTGTGNDGNTNGIITGITMASVNIANANFGVNAIPTANSVTMDSQSIPLGSNPFTVPTLTGNDREDGAYTGVAKSNTIIIKTLPNDAILYYNGVAVAVGQTITNYDPSVLVFDPTTEVPPLTVSFTFSEVDAACAESLPATVTIRFSQVVPVNLIYFTAKKQGTNQSLLDWATSSEQNSQQFDVYRSTDGGQTWVKIGEKAAAGNSNTEKTYSLVDESPKTGRNYYRLKMIDKDGTFKWSVIRWVDFGDITPVNIVLYPNPVVNTLSINGLQNAKEVVVYDAVGRLVAKDVVVATTHDIDMSRMAKGLYHVVVLGKDGSRLATEKVVKQ